MKGKYTSENGMTIYLGQGKYPQTSKLRLMLYSLSANRKKLDEFSEITVNSFNTNQSEAIVSNHFLKMIPSDIKNHYMGLLFDMERRPRQVNTGFGAYQQYSLNKGALDEIPRIEKLLAMKSYM